jgi:HEXXH motif-containing protein
MECVDALVVAISKTSEGFPGMCAVADSLGASGFQPPVQNQLSEFLEVLDQARKIVSTLPEYHEMVLKNTGFIVPFLCKPPSVGSGSALQIPGALLLPANVPAVVLAECWIHEALHTELHLAEWLEGVPPACATNDLPTPWRTVKRPASLLLHGAYVFSSLLKFINAMSSAYNQVPSHWHLSATRGTQILVNNVKETMDFRKSQIVEALQCLNSAASFTHYGKNTMALIREQLLINDGILAS